MRFLSALLLLPIALLSSADPATGAGAVPFPEALPAEQFNEVLVRVGDDLFIAGQPTAAGLEELAAAGVGTVVNLRTDGEMNNRSVVPYDEAALIDELGMRYVHIPSGGPDSPYSADMVDQFAAALDTTDGKVLLHCTVAWRASHLYTAYLHRVAGLSLADAVRHGQAINLGQLPLEGFLGVPITISVVDE